MRKWFYAGAVAGGFLLLGAAPAQADVLPAPAGDRLGWLTGDGAGQGLGPDPAGGPGPAGPLVGGLTGGATRGGGLGSLIPADLLGGGLLGGGLTPDGWTGAAGPQRESALFDGGVPLLGGLGGKLPANESPRTLPATGEGTPTGMPAGGTAVDPALADPALADPAPSGPPATDPAVTPQPSTVDPTPSVPTGQPKGQTVDDPRLHEEPVDDEAGGRQRPFSPGGRPIAGEDEDFR